MPTQRQVIKGGNVSLKPIIQGVAAVFAAALILIAPIAATAAPSQIEINPGNVPTTAAGFENQSCENLPDLGENEDGWVFVLPSSAGAEGNFISLTATFEDSEGGTHERSATVINGSGDNKAYIVTPAGWTLISAVATVEEPDEDAFFNLTHACPGVPEEPTEEPTTDEPTTDEPTTDEPTTDEPTTDEPTTEGPTTDEPTTPGEETTTPDDETTSPKAEDRTPPKLDESPAPRDDGPQPESLNQTGNDLTVLLAAGAALLFAGLGALYLVRRRFGRVD